MTRCVVLTRQGNFEDGDLDVHVNENFPSPLMSHDVRVLLG